jgi:hypothetical protein
MKINGPIWLVTGSCLAAAAAATAFGVDDPPAGSDEFRVDLAYGGRWCDAEKTRASKRDDLACWAAAAANMLAWTGWGIDAGFKDEDEILAHLVKHIGDSGADSPRDVWNWWFSGDLVDTGGRPKTIGGGGFFKDTAFPEYVWKSPRGGLYRGLGSKMIQRNPLALKALLDEGYGVAIQVVRPRKGGGRASHMIALWGYTYDEKQAFKGIVVSDSDDAKNNRNPRRARNALRYYPVTLRDGTWWFKLNGGDEFQILAAYGLARKEGAGEKQAEKLLEKASKLRKQEDYLAALTLYDEIVGASAATDAGKQAREIASAMRADPAVAKKIEAQRRTNLEQAAAKECGNWLAMARSLARAGGHKGARRYYRKVIDGYPETKYAKTAKEEMDRLPR